MINPRYTLLAKVVGTAVTGIGTAQQLEPTRSWPKEFTDEWAAAEGLYRIQRKAVGKYQTSISTDPYFQVDAVYDNQVVDMSVDDRKAVMEQELANAYHDARDAGVTFNGIFINTSPDAQGEITRLMEKTTRRGGTHKFVTRGRKSVQMSAVEATALRDAVEDYIEACDAREYDLQVAIDAATTHAELDAIDVTVGW